MSECGPSRLKSMSARVSVIGRKADIKSVVPSGCRDTKVKTVYFIAEQRAPKGLMVVGGFDVGVSLPRDRAGGHKLDRNYCPGAPSVAHIGDFCLVPPLPKRSSYSCDQGVRGR